MNHNNRPIRSSFEPHLTRRAFLAIVAAATVACARSEASPRTRFDPVSLSPGYPDQSMLVNPAWLRERLDSPQLRLFDLAGLPDYRDGHIPGAAHFWWQDLIEIHNPVYGMLLGPDARAALMRESGIAPDSTVVCYDHSGGNYASRLIWVLRYMGFPRVYLLIGGLQGWVETGGDLSRSSAEYAPSTGIDDIRDETINANAADILSRLDEPGLAILDTRFATDLDETWRGQLRKGRIPGSYSLPRSRFVLEGPVPALVSPETLTERLAEAGIDLGATSEIIVYDLHGTLASLPWLALTALAGPHIRLYDGSWAEWGSREDLPVEGFPE